MGKSVVVDCLPRSADRYVADHALIVVDVIRATTTAVTAVAAGRSCYPIASLGMAMPLAAELEHPLLVGEVGGYMPRGFDLTNSPAAVAARSDVWRPMILLSSSGTRLMHRASRASATYVAALRNLSATVRHVGARHSAVAVLGAGTRGVFREEDEACCAWIAEGLLAYGFEPGNADTEGALSRWSGRPRDGWLGSPSVRYLRGTNQVADLSFILAHDDDLDCAFAISEGQVVALPPERGEEANEWAIASAAEVQA